LLDAWQKAATTELAQVEKWWSRWANANIGIATGGRIVVIDLDVKHPPVDGIDEWGGVCLDNDIDDNTLAASTPSGGVHLFFSKSVEIHNSASKIAPGVDVRGDGGYVVAAPSIVDGKRYEWEKPPATILPLPGVLVELLEYKAPPPSRPAGEFSGKDCSAYVGAAIAGELDMLSKATNGTKHDTLNRVSFNLGQLLGSSWAHPDRATIEAQIWAVVETLPDVEDYDAAFRTMQRALDDGEKHQRPEPQGDYPVQVALYRQGIERGKPVLVVDDQDTAIMCLETVKDAVGVIAPTRAGVPWAQAWTNVLVGLDECQIIIWMRDVATSGTIANALLHEGVRKVRVYRGEAQNLKPWLRNLL
jgi:hypothetical protein